MGRKASNRDRRAPETNPIEELLMSIRMRLRHLLVLASACLPAYAVAQPDVVGWIEPVRLGEGVVIPAKLDTGADTSSLHASDLSWSRRPDGDWVAFDVIGQDNRKVRLERKVERVTRVKKASGGVQSRPVVLLSVCLGNTYRTTEVNLTDRAGFKLPFLIGRSFLAERFAVDSSRVETTQPACKTTTASAATSG
jgi:hypothetical protein